MAPRASWRGRPPLWWARASRSRSPGATSPPLAPVTGAGPRRLRRGPSRLRRRGSSEIAPIDGGADHPLGKRVRLPARRGDPQRGLDRIVEADGAGPRPSRRDRSKSACCGSRTSPSSMLRYRRFAAVLTPSALLRASPPRSVPIVASGAVAAGPSRTAARQWHDRSGASARRACAPDRPTFADAHLQAERRAVDARIRQSRPAAGELRPESQLLRRPRRHPKRRSERPCRRSTPPRRWTKADALWLLAMVDGRTEIFDAAMEPAGAIASGAAISPASTPAAAAHRSSCDAPRRRPGRGSGVCDCQPRGRGDGPAGGAPGPVTALWPSGVAVVRNAATGNIRLMRLTVTCALVSACIGVSSRQWPSPRGHPPALRRRAARRAPRPDRSSRPAAVRPRHRAAQRPFAITRWEAGHRAVYTADENAPGGRPFLDSVDVQMARPDARPGDRARAGRCCRARARRAAARPGRPADLVQLARAADRAGVRPARRGRPCA